eukprot:870794-Pelagomonas_calceolata.AAC.1
MQKLPGFEVSFQLPRATLLGALKRTDLQHHGKEHQVSEQTVLAVTPAALPEPAVAPTDPPEPVSMPEPSLFGIKITM